MKTTFFSSLLLIVSLLASLNKVGNILFSEVDVMVSKSITKVRERKIQSPLMLMQSTRMRAVPIIGFANFAKNITLISCLSYLACSNNASIFLNFNYIL